MAVKERAALRRFEDQLKQLIEVAADRHLIKSPTLQGLADKMKVSGAYISQIIRRHPSLDQLERIAAALGVEPGEFDTYTALSLESQLRAGDVEAIRRALLLNKIERMSERKRNKFYADALADDE